MKNVLVSPSILAADFNNLSKEISVMEQNGASWLHFDVMDGHFVKNISFGIPVLKSISKSHHLLNDVHIMISNPKEYSEKFINAGADILTFHYEACKNDKEVQEVIDIIKNNNVKVGLSIKPNTNIEVVYPFLKDLFLVLIMSVEPGFGGQSFIEESYDKIKTLREYIDKNHYQTLIEVDGGICDIVAKKCLQAGVDVFVAGSYLFGKSDVKKRIDILKGKDE